MFFYLSETRPGVALDACAAFAAAQLGAAQGDMDCVAALALCHLKGIGTEVNFSKAKDLCPQSMVSFSPMACYVQGMLTLEDKAAPVLLKKRTAISYLQIAASAEMNASAAFNLAMLLSDAGDEFCDIPQAIRLLKFPCDLGVQSAHDLLARLDPQNSSLAHSSQVQPSHQPLSLTVEGQPTSSQLAQSAGSDIASIFQSLDLKLCKKICSSIFVRSDCVADVQECKKDVLPCDNFEVSSSAEACLAPNLLVIDDGFFFGPVAHAGSGHTVQLHFPKFDTTGAYIPAAPVTLQTSGSLHNQQPYTTTRQCSFCHMQVMFCAFTF